MIHKRITSNKKNESFDYMLCSAVQFNDKTKPNGEWKRECKVHWRFVTCPICLSLKGIKKIYGEESIRSIC